MDASSVESTRSVSKRDTGGYFRNSFQYNPGSAAFRVWKSEPRVSPIDGHRVGVPGTPARSLSMQTSRVGSRGPRLAIGFVPLMLRDRPSRFSRVTVNRPPENWIRPKEPTCESKYPGYANVLVI
ncbi:hypothetical protein K0M31_000620 [Melipona bicolor]|uniref:Uncharacterized protein n=1 Tax=Melipona bicolor TaxID=60889 RepID=A0AA40GDW9_9HYME|nr:hypothetical protein K0M31_000620 [Melipona bicolor]